ncbi:MAG: inositol monophosphatase family protein [Pseudomonas sp.]|uniref:inositol monophosphatase family protein n=1 Tax=Pseudomonas sp. TaxID=306 RepID=UPI0027181B1E|nr:inositol monophosphatase family protein [Pseudomonas sp.]MDO8403144.1 inositol monophosphatase family protein [Pseudomonas sp.]
MLGPDFEPTRELHFALQMADAADAFTLPKYVNRSFYVDWKANRTEVTEADRECERLISERVLADRPAHGMFGEEHGLVGDADSPWRWIVDPIDGTSNFVRGIPVWATLIALTHIEHGPVVGVVSAPAMGRRWWAARGLGAFADGKKCEVSNVAAIAEAQVSVTFAKGWDDLGLTGKLVQLQQRAYRARGFGDFWQHMLVAEGAVDLAIDAVGLEPYDLAAVMVVVEEAGGTFTDRHGERTYLHSTAISSNGLLHGEIAGLGA